MLNTCGGGAKRTKIASPPNGMNTTNKIANKRWLNRASGRRKNGIGFYY